MSMKRLAILVAIVVLGLIVLGRAGNILVDWLWFSSIGYVGVFWTIFTTRAVLFLVVFAVSAGAFWLSGGLALRFAGQPAVWPPPLVPGLSRDRARKPRFELLGYATSHVPWRLLVAGVAVLLGLLTAFIELSNWDVVLRFLYQVPYGESDPVFGKDIGFYLFSLPAYVALKNWLLLLAGLQRGHRRRRVLGARRHRARQAAATAVAQPSSPMPRRCSASTSR